MRRIAMVLFLFILSVSFCACGNADNKVNSDSDVTTSTVGEIEVQKMIDSYKVPSKVVDIIDLTEEDPSNDEISFAFNTDGSVGSCSYKANGIDYFITFTYNNNNIDVYAFSGSIVVTNTTFIAKSAYNPEIGFIEHNGYYLKGFEF